MTVLVTGATGNVGAHVVAELQRRGVPVRALVRDAGRAAARLGCQVQLARGDFGDAGSLRRALAGVDRVFLSSADGPEKVAHEAAVVDACAAAGVALVVKASTLAADPRSPLAPLAWNGRSEAHLRRSGVPAAILGSGFYTTNVAMSVHDGRLVAPAGDGRIGMIDPADVGAVAGAVLTSGDHAGRTYRLTGPEAISYADAAAILGLDYMDVPPAAARAGFAAAGLPEWLARHLDGMFALIRAGGFADVTDTVRVLTGRDARGFAASAPAARQQHAGGHRRGDHRGQHDEAERRGAAAA
jgi:uncharacterized protein YbjT (DUF2867 family)